MSTSEQADRIVAGRTRVGVADTRRRRRRRRRRRHRSRPDRDGGTPHRSARRGSRTWTRGCDPWWRRPTRSARRSSRSPTRTREAFESVMASFKLPKETDEEKASRTLRIQEAYEAAAAVPLQLATRCGAADGARRGRDRDGESARRLGRLLGGRRSCSPPPSSAMANVRINAAGLKDEAKGQRLVDECDALRDRADTSSSSRWRKRSSCVFALTSSGGARFPLGLRFGDGEDRIDRLRLPGRRAARAVLGRRARVDRRPLRRGGARAARLEGHLRSRGRPVGDGRASRDGADLPVLFFTEVPEEKAAKNRVHLDLAADLPLEDEVQRLEGLGATVRNWAEDGGSTWCVMLDPEGNEFCVVTSRARTTTRTTDRADDRD